MGSAPDIGHCVAFGVGPGPCHRDYIVHMRTFHEPGVLRLPRCVRSALSARNDAVGVPRYDSLGRGGSGDIHRPLSAMRPPGPARPFIGRYSFQGLDWVPPAGFEPAASPCARRGLYPLSYGGSPFPASGFPETCISYNMYMTIEDTSVL